MSDFTVNITFDSQFGTSGTGNGQFDYPSGICVLGSNIYVVDKQNHRVQKFDLAGVFVLEFGSVGTGNNQFYFPEAICTDGTNLYIVDSANHRIKKHSVTGTFISEFGSVGTGDNNFDYPTDIIYNSTYLYIADKQNHRIKKHTITGTFVFEFGTYGTGNDELNFPEGVDIIDNRIIVADSANKVIKFFDMVGGFLYKTNITFDYPTEVVVTDTIITVIDKQANRFVFLDDVGNFISQYGSIGTGNDEFYFPAYAVYDNDLLYITDSANHKVKIMNFAVEEVLPRYFNIFTKLAAQLYPTGRAWWMPRLGIFRKFHEGLSLSEARLHELNINLLDSIIPDNDNYDTEDATDHESALGLYNQTYLTLEERKTIILEKMQFPGNIPARQHYLYLQGRLRALGFDVYVHENKFGDPPTVLMVQDAIYGKMFYGTYNYGDESIGVETIVANYINESLDADYVVGDEDNFRATFFISGTNYDDLGFIPKNRKDEFRNEILKIKPCQTVALLNIKYTPLETLELEGGGSLELESGGDLQLEIQ